MPETDATTYNLTPYGTEGMYQNLVQTLSSLKAIKHSDMLICFLGLLGYADAVTTVNVLASTHVSMLPVLVANRRRLNIKDIHASSIATATPKSLLTIMNALVEHPFLVKYGSITAKLGDVSYKSLGVTDDQAKYLMMALKMGDVVEGFDYLMSEANDDLIKAKRILMNVKFDELLKAHGISIVDPVDQTPLNLLIHDISVTRDVFNRYLTLDAMSVVLAVYLNLTRFDDDIMAMIGKTSVTTFPLNAIVMAHTNTDLDVACENYQLNDAKPMDPWNMTQDVSEFKPLNAHILERRALPLDDGQSIDKFHRDCASVDNYGTQQRLVREETPVRDRLTKEETMVTHVEPALRMLRSDCESVTTVHAYISSSQTLGSIVNGIVPVNQFPLPLLPNEVVGKKNTFTDDPDIFATKVLKAKDAILIIDNLDYEPSLTSDDKTYMTSSYNTHKVGKAVIMLSNIIGKAHDQRRDITTYPKFIYWRTVMSQASTLVNNFDNLVTRLDSIYKITYSPPSHPHEPQFVLACRRRDAYQTNPAIGTREGFKMQPGQFVRSAAYVLRAIDIHRYYSGIICRKLVYDGFYTRTMMALIRDVISSILFKTPEPAMGRIIESPKFYPDDVIEEAHEAVINFLSLARAGRKNKNRKSRGPSAGTVLAKDVDEGYFNFTRAILQPYDNRVAINEF